MKQKALERILSLVLFFSFTLGALCIFVAPLCAADLSKVPSWNPGDGKDWIKDISVIEPGLNLVVAETTDSLGNYYQDVALYTMGDDGEKKSGPFIYGGSWDTNAAEGIPEYDALSGRYIFNIFGHEYVSADIFQGTLFRVYEDGTYVQNELGENWHHFFNPEGAEFVEAKSHYFAGTILSDGSRLAVGEIVMPYAVNKSYNPLVVCISSGGEVLWHQVLNGFHTGENFTNWDKAVDCVEYGGYLYVLIDTMSEGPGSESNQNNAYKVVKLDMNGDYLDGEVFGGWGNEYPSEIFIYDGSLVVCGYMDTNLSQPKIFVNKISLDFTEMSGFPIIENNDDNRYYVHASTFKGEIVHVTGRVLIDADREDRLFHMGINLETKEQAYLRFVGTGEDIEYIGRGIDVTVDGNVLVGGLRKDTNYDYFLSFLDLSLQIQTQEISLNAGWNLISFYVQPEDTDISVVLALVDCEKVWTLFEDVWYLYDPANPLFSDLLEMYAGQGYMIKMASAATLFVSGVVVDEAIFLSSGWEMPGYLSATTYPTEDALDSIFGKYDKVWTIEDGFWKLYDPANLLFSDLLEMKPGQGYMMKINDSCTWTVD